MKNPSMELIKDECSSGEFVTTPIKLYTESLISAKLTPTERNNNFAVSKVFPKYIPILPKNTIKRAINIARLYPNRGKNEATKNDTKAIGKSLKASKIEA